VSIAHQGEGYGLNWTLWVVAQPGERNEIVVSYGATGIRVTDSVPLSAGDHCALQLAGSVVCQPLPGSWEPAMIACFRAAAGTSPAPGQETTCCARAMAWRRSWSAGPGRIGCSPTRSITSHPAASGARRHRRTGIPASRMRSLA
jgi:hypothetical protein